MAAPNVDFPLLKLEPTCHAHDEWICDVTAHEIFGEERECPWKEDFAQIFGPNGGGPTTGATSTIGTQQPSGETDLARCGTPPCVGFRNNYHSWSPILAPRREMSILRPQTDLRLLDAN